MVPGSLFRRMLLSVNNSEKDIIPPISLDYDCGEFIGQVKFKDIHLELPLKGVANRLDDLRLASHKVDEVNRLILEQEWKIKHSTSYSQLSILTYVGMLTTGVVVIFCYCCCCRCCKRRYPLFFKWCKDNPCTIIIKPKIVNSVHSSRESLRPVSRSNRLRGSVQEDAIDETELVTLRSCNRPVAPSGKR